jgi:hypothetical protein
MMNFFGDRDIQVFDGLIMTNVRYLQTSDGFRNDLICFINFRIYCNFTSVVYF